MPLSSISILIPNIKSVNPHFDTLKFSLNLETVLTIMRNFNNNLHIINIKSYNKSEFILKLFEKKHMEQYWIVKILFYLKTLQWFDSTGGELTV